MNCCLKIEIEKRMRLRPLSRGYFLSPGFSIRTKKTGDLQSSEYFYKSTQFQFLLFNFPVFITFGKNLTYAILACKIGTF